MAVSVRETKIYINLKKVELFRFTFSNNGQFDYGLFFCYHQKHELIACWDTEKESKVNVVGKYIYMYEI